MAKIYRNSIHLLVFCGFFGGQFYPVSVHAGNPSKVKLEQKNVPAETGVSQAQETPGVNNAPAPEYHEAAPAVTDEFVEMWEINSASTTPGGKLDKQYMLSPASYFKFLNHKDVEFRLNEFYPVQKGTYKQNQVRMDIYVIKESTCEKCIDHFTISRNTIEDPELLLEFNGYQQIFTINKIR